MAQNQAGSKARFQIVQGYVKLCHVDSKTGRVLSPQEFVPSKRGRIWAVVDTKKSKVVDAQWSPQKAGEALKRFLGDRAA